MAGEQHQIITEPKLNKPCILLIVIAGMERFAFKGVAANLVTYLTEVMKMKNSSAAKMVNNWIGFTSIMPLLVASLADSYWNKYTTIQVSSFLYLLGLVALTSTAMEWPWIPASKGGAASCLSWSLYMISLGQGGYNPSLQAFAADQLLPSSSNNSNVKTNNNEDNKKSSLFFHWWYFGICSGCLLGISLLAYIEDNIGWGLGFAIPTATMLLSIAFFTSASRFYVYKQSHPTTTAAAAANFTKSIENMMANFRAAAKKLVFPESSAHDQKEVEEKKSLCRHGDIEGFELELELEPMEEDDMNLVDILKAVWRLLPIWVLLLTFAVIFQQPPTFFTKQGMTMQRNIIGGFKIPPAALQSVITVSIILLMPLYDAVFVPFMRTITRNEKGITVMQRMGVGMLLSVVAMAIAAVVEEKRLKSEVMSIFWLLPQYIILGISDIFTVVGMQEFFYGEVPARMKTVGIAMCTSVFGVGSFVSAFLITVVEKLTAGGGGDKQSWFSDDMDEARLDKYYWLLAMASAFSLLLFIVFCKFYTTRT